jgi:hypothetical protein
LLPGAYMLLIYLLRNLIFKYSLDYILLGVVAQLTFFPSACSWEFTNIIRIKTKKKNISFINCGLDATVFLILILNKLI